MDLQEERLIVLLLICAALLGKLYYNKLVK